MGWLRFEGFLKTYVSFAEEPYERDYILKKRSVILRSPLIIATPYIQYHHNTPCYNDTKLQHTATHCNTLQNTATQCNTLQHTAQHCNTLQNTATHCTILNATMG